MLNKAYYEERILNEIRLLPETALPSVVRWLSFFREELTYFETNPKTRPLEIQQTFPIQRNVNVEEILQIGRDCAALPDIDTRTPDEILGYDKSPIGLWNDKYGT
jgi:hypothetical protein